MSTELPQEVQGQIAQLQQIQQQAQVIGSQKAQIEALTRENESALKELEKMVDDAVVYKSAGGIMVRSNKADTLKDLKEQKEQFDMRIKTLDRQSERLQKRFDELQNSIKEHLDSTNLGIGGGPTGS